MVNAAAIDAVLHRATEAQEIAGAVAMVTTASETLYQGCFGTSDPSPSSA
jgi:hypothetical protein